MKRLLLTYNEADSVEAILQDLNRGGFPEELEAKVLCVADVWVPPEGGVQPESETTFPENLRTARARALQVINASGEVAEQVSDRLKAAFPGWTISAVASAGPPPQTVVNAARGWAADLVVTSWRELSFIKRLLSESEPQKVALLAPCSVRIARPTVRRQKRAPRIVLAIDGSADAKAAVQTVITRSWPIGSKFQVVTIIDPKHYPSNYQATFFAEDWMEQHDASASDMLSRYAESAAKQLRHSGLDVEIHILEGDLKGRLLHHAEAWEADGIFLGARGQENGDGQSLGRFAEMLTKNTPCSVELIRQPLVNPDIIAQPIPEREWAVCAGGL